MNKDLSKLTMAEELWLWRIRQPSIPRPDSLYKRSDMTRGEAAKFLGMSLDRYKNLEAGRRINIAVDELPSLAFLRMPRPEISLREQLLLARRRSGLLIRQIADDYGLSHTRLLAHEEMASRRLIDYWSAKGFTGWNLPAEMQPVPVRPRPVLVRREEPARREPPRPRPTLQQPVVRPARPQLVKRNAVRPTEAA